MKKPLALLALGAIALVALAAVPVGQANAREYHLTRSEARVYMVTGLVRQFHNNFRHGYNYRLKCVRRINRARIRCMKVQWVIGDFFYYGTGSVWYSQKRNGTHWNYSFRITRVNGYCAAVRHGSKCTRKFVVK